MIKHLFKYIPLGFALATLMFCTTQLQAQQKKVKILNYTIQLDLLSKGFDSTGYWFHPRAGAIPGKVPTVVLTMQKWLLNTNDVFMPLNEIRTHDLGKTWTKPVAHTATLGRQPEPNNVQVGVSDYTPKYHQKSGKLLGTGHTVRYIGTEHAPNPPRTTAWSVYNAATHTWSNWADLIMPNIPKFYNIGAGCTQRVDLPNGDILLPVYYKLNAEPQGTMKLAATVVRCKFDGKNLTYVEHGNEMTVPNGRGFAEPSLTKFKDKYYLTLRNNDLGYVATSKDGLHFDKPKTWRFDDGQDLGSYNTQQHWVTHSNGLFLVYTRRGANNDHVFRHRAPLFMAQVDPKRLVVIRSTEKILAPNKGARMGNFGVINVNENETWITTAEGMAQGGQEYGADNHVYAARIIWQKKNKIWNKL